MENQHENPLGCEPINHLMARFAIPSIIAMLVSALYNMVDQFFIGHSVGMQGNAATNVAFPLTITCTAVSLLFGIGGAANFNLSMGRKKAEEAKHFIGNAIFLMLSFGISLCLVVCLFLNPLLKLFGATADILAYSQTYTSITAFGFPFLILSTGGSNLVRADGSPRFSMTCTLIGCLVNLILDPLFIFQFRLGVAGAAYATILSQFVSFCILFCMTRQGANIPIRFRNMHPSWPILKEIVAGGAPSLIRQGTQSLSTIFLNVAAGGFGDAAIAAMSIVTRLSFFAASVIIGFGQGFQPVCGFSYGARKYGRLREGFWFAVKAGTLFALLAAAVAIVWAVPILGEFRNDPLVISTGAQALRAQAMTFFLVPLTILTNMCLQTTRKTGGAMLVAAGRSGLFLIPTLLVLPRAFGLTGLVWSQSVSDLCGFLLAAVLIRKFFQKLPEK